MTVDRAWVARNLGFDPKTTPVPISTFVVAAASKAPSDGDLQREIILAGHKLYIANETVIASDAGHATGSVRIDGNGACRKG